MEKIKTYYIETMRKLIAIRETELFISKKYEEGYFRCPVHLAIGHEAVPSAIFSLYKENRFAFSYHRSHHHFLACGASPEELLYELAGLSKGCCHGHGGSHHLRNEKVGFLGSTPIISGTIPVAVGYSHGLKLKNIKGRVFVFSGDTIAEEGLFHESLNAASLYQLPITFVIEDNGLSCFTPSRDRQGHSGYRNIAQSFNIPYFSIDGSSIENCLSQLMKHKDLTDNNLGPTLVHAKVYRPYEHCGYQIEDSVDWRKISESWPKLDPLHNANGEFSITKFCDEGTRREFSEIAQATIKRCNEAFEVIKKERGN